MSALVAVLDVLRWCGVVLLSVWLIVGMTALAALLVWLHGEWRRASRALPMGWRCSVCGRPFGHGRPLVAHLLAVHADDALPRVDA